jgi:hypothetical protein
VLIDIDTGKSIDSVPFRKDFDTLRGRLSEAEFDDMVARIDELFDEAGAEIATAGWLPGSDWRGTPFQPIYEKAAREDFGRSAMFFGQLVWYTVMNRPERWGSGKYQVDGRDIGSRTYFRLNCRPMAQQYSDTSKVKNGYCPHHATGVKLPDDFVVTPLQYVD